MAGDRMCPGLRRRGARAAGDLRRRARHDGAADGSGRQGSDERRSVDTMLRNVDAQAKIEADAVLAHVREEMRARVIGLERWLIRGVNLPDIEKLPATFDDDVVKCPKSVECVFRELKAAPTRRLSPSRADPGPNRREGEGDHRQIAALRAELMALKAAAKDKDEPRVAHAFALLEEHNKSVLAFATKAADLLRAKRPRRHWTRSARASTRSSRSTR